MKENKLKSEHDDAPNLVTNHNTTTTRMQISTERIWRCRGAISNAMETIMRKQEHLIIYGQNSSMASHVFSSDLLFIYFNAPNNDSKRA